MARHFNGFVSRFSAGARDRYSVTVHFPWAPAGVPATEFEAHDVCLNGSPVAGLLALTAGGWLEFTVREGGPARRSGGSGLDGAIGRVIELAVSDPRLPGSSHAVSGRITGVAVDPAAPDGRRYKMLVAPVIL